MPACIQAPTPGTRLPRGPALAAQGGRDAFVARRLGLPPARSQPIPDVPVRLHPVTHCVRGLPDPRCQGDDTVRLDHASQLLCLPEDLPPEPQLEPDGSVPWQATMAARVEALHRLAMPAAGPATADPFVAGGLRHAALLMLLGRCLDTPEPATLELGLLSELLQAAAVAESDEPLGADFVGEPWRLRDVEAFVAHLRQGHSHIGVATMFGALVPSWRIDSHVVPAIRRWVWSCTTPLAGAQLRQTAAAVSEMFNECAVLLCRLDAHASPARRDGVMAVAMSVASIWSLQILHAARRRRLAPEARRAPATAVADAQFGRVCRHELASSTVVALRAVARLDVEPALQRALRVFCARQYDVASRSMAEFAPFDAGVDAPVSGLAGAGPAGRPAAPAPTAGTP